jgi:hypothetical protein
LIMIVSIECQGALCGALPDQRARPVLVPPASTCWRCPQYRVMKAESISQRKKSRASSH